MDVNCTRCGEPWDVHYLRHDSDEEPGFVFGRNRLVVVRCPSCRERPRSRTASQRRALVEEMAAIFGEDLDGLAAEMDDLATLFTDTQEPPHDHQKQPATAARGPRVHARRSVSR